MKKLLLLLVFAAVSWGQTCALQFTLTAVGNSPVFDNRGAGCTTWTLTYNSYGFSVLSLVVQTAPNNGGVPGSWSTFAAVTGINPNTAIDEGVSTFGGQTSYFPFLRVRLASATGTGQIQGKLYANVNTFSIVVNPTPPVTPGLPFNSVQYNCAGAFCGSADLLWINTPLTTPAAPVLTKNGAGIGTTWGYKLVAQSIVGGTRYSAQATISGNATLDGTHSISVATVDQDGCSTISVFRSTAGGTPGTTGWIGDVTCGSTLIDTGLTAGTTPDYQDNYTSGLGTTKRITQITPDDGTTRWGYFGTPISSASAHAVRFDDSKYVFIQSGSTAGGTGTVNRVLHVVADANAASSNIPAMEIDSFGAGGGTAAVLYSFGANTGTIDISDMAVQESHMVTYDTGKIAIGVGFRGTFTGAASTGEITNWYDFEALDEDGFSAPTVTHINFRSELTAAVNKWSFYGAGSAANKLPETVFASLLAYANAAQVFCTNCTVTTGIDNTCAGAGSGAVAQRINGVWKCFI